MSASSKVFFTAYLWNMFGKLIIRFVSVISTLVLVRLLSPEDFGVMAIATMVIGFFAVLSNAGINRYLIMLESPTIIDYDKAFTLNLLLRICSFILVISLALIASYFFDKNEIAIVIVLVGLASFLASFRSIGLIELERKMSYGPINKIQITSKLIATVFTLGIAYFYRSYYALILGTFIIEIVTITLSYRVHEWKFRLNFQFDREIFSFSTFLLLRNIISYSRSQIDILLVGKRFDEVELGRFSIARQFAIMPLTEVVAPAVQPAFSALSRLKHNQALYLEKIYQSLFLVFLFLFPSAFGLYTLSESFVYVVLGSKWMGVSSYIGILSFLMVPFFLQAIISIAYDNLGKVKVSFLVDLFGLSLIILTFFAILPDTLEQFASLRLFVGAVSFCVSVALARFFLKIDIVKFLIVFCVPLLSSSFMYFCVKQMVWFEHNQYLHLFAVSIFGAAIYIVFNLLCLVFCLKFTVNAWLLTLVPSIVYEKIELWLRISVPKVLKN